MLTNRLVLNAALGQEEKIGEQKVKIAKIPELAEEDDPVEWLSRNISVSFPHKDEIMKVSITTKDPLQSVAIMRAVVNSYMKNVVEDERTKRDKRIAELRSIQAQKEEEVKDGLNELKKMAKIAGISDTDTLNVQQKNTLDELANLRQQSIALQFNLNRMKAELASLNAAKEFMQQEPLAEVEVQISCPNDPILRNLGDLLAWEQQNKFTAIGIQKNNRSTNIQDASNAVARVEMQYKERIGQLGAELRNKKMNDVEREIKKLDAQIEIASKQYNVIEEELKQLRKDARSIGGTSIDIQMRRDAVARSQKSLRKISAELEKQELESHAPLRVTLVGNAEVEKGSE
ncbi:MAG: hypothetical protein IT426_11780 [Pirellulales bacterium]|nr:hypothetical protein [Pirellulales bacterium]